MDDGLSTRKTVAECRICHDEDEPNNLETPCACCGTLKFAHRSCVQRWCTEKGDAICEICGQNYEPGYTAPPPLFQFAALPIPFRGSWEVPRRIHHGDHFMSMVQSEHDLFEPLFDIHLSHGTVMCYRVIAAIFIVLLILRHALPIIVDGAGEYSFALYALLIFGSIGVMVPILVMLKGWNVLYHRQRRHRQDVDGSFGSASDGGIAEISLVQPQFHLIRIR